MELLQIGLQLTFTGMVVVFIGLALLVGVVSLFQYVGQPAKAKKIEAAPTNTMAAPEPVPAPFADGEITPELVIVLAAAAASILGKSVRVTRVRYRTTRPTPIWTYQGRAAIMARHQIVRRVSSSDRG
ncbi:MAG: OadG family protein [Chloroflexaceae bacterium]|nr:OadG family protein [Chloroflexaceae bacterium]NJO04989.1 OadG family protein [Chloroflexaceae bacterium]